jgi:plasmid maintenance system antidote protein VapI
MTTRYRALETHITHYREAAGLTVAQLAEAIGVNRSSLTEQIKGNRPMPWPVAARIAAKLDVPPHLLVEPVHQSDDAEPEVVS